MTDENCTNDPNEVRSKFPQPIIAENSEDTEPEDIRFSPPLYRQRYSLAIDFIKKVGPAKVVDFGCAECKFLWTLRNHSYAYVREIIGVDIDKNVLERHLQVAKPVTSEYLIRRATPLKIALYRGSLTEWDPRIEGVDFVSLIEVIEHLEEDTLAQLPAAIFGRLRAKHVLITTPNSEFNILFKNLSGFRHPDHKFEWTRDEFMTWCEAVCHNYPYLVEFCGVGEPPMGLEDVGYCSQGAFFSIKPEIKIETSFSMKEKENGDEANESEDTERESIFSNIEIPQLIINTEPTNTSKAEPTETADTEPEPSSAYEVIISTDFPMEDPSITPTHKLILEIEYYAHQIAKNEWRKLTELSDVREEDLHRHPVHSDWVSFEPGTGEGHIIAFVSIEQRLMSYPQISAFGNVEHVLNSVISSQSGNLNSELTHYRVELMEETGYNADSDEKEGDTNWNQDDQVEWNNIFQENVPDRSCALVPEDWDNDDLESKD